MANDLRSCLQSILEYYPEVAKPPFGVDNRLWSYFDGATERLRSSEMIQQSQTLKLKWGVGKGKWADVPWIAILDSRETNTTQRGIYCVLLFRQDMSGVYLTLNQGITDPEREHGVEGLASLKKSAIEIRKQYPDLTTAGFVLDDRIDLRADPGRGKKYEAATIAYKLYEKGIIPDEQTLLADLRALLRVHDTLIGLRSGKPSAGPSFWIFQANPKTFDVVGAIKNLKDITFSVSRFKDRIKPGDVVFLWEAGESAGIVGTAKILTQPKEIPHSQATAEYFLDLEKLEQVRDRVQIEVQKILPTRISKRTIRENPTLSVLSIIRSPEGTNFEVTHEEAKVLMAMIGENANGASPMIVSEFFKDASDLGFIFPIGLVRRFVFSCLTKPFVILTGNSGSGKTKLAQIFAKWLVGDGGHRLIPVGADWTDNRNILGYYNPLNSQYMSTPILDLMLEAQRNENKHKPFFLILDEMNLSHVERYFSDFLSSMESRSKVPLHTKAGEVRSTSGEIVPNHIDIPLNLFIVGTVNVDETTYMFSPKVLDRANVLEFRVDEAMIEEFLGKERSTQAISTVPATLDYSKAFLSLSYSAREVNGFEPLNVDHMEYANIHRTIKDTFSILSHFNLEYAYRVVTEIQRYACVDFAISGEEDWEWQETMDAQIMQKILPKLHGSRGKMEAVLVALAEYCKTGDPATAQTYFPGKSSPAGYRVVDHGTPVFKDSYRKLCRMINTARRDQFVSFIQ